MDTITTYKTRLMYRAQDEWRCVPFGIRGMPRIPVQKTRISSLEFIIPGAVVDPKTMEKFLSMPVGIEEWALIWASGGGIKLSATKACAYFEERNGFAEEIQPKITLYDVAVEAIPCDNSEFLKGYCVADVFNLEWVEPI